MMITARGPWAKLLVTLEKNFFFIIIISFRAWENIEVEKSQSAACALTTAGLLLN